MSMTYKAKLFLLSTTVIGAVVCSTMLLADTLTREVTTTTTTTTQEMGSPAIRLTPAGAQPAGRAHRYATDANGAYVVNFTDFDLSRDGILSSREIGDVLFGVYDTDGNGLIDNVEYERRATANITPVEHNTVIYYDFDGDGDADETAYTYETFSRQMPFSRFEKTGKGVSLRELTDMSFNFADMNNDRFVNNDEWQKVFMPSIYTSNNQRAPLNR